MNDIPYHFNRNLHSLNGARHGLAYLLDNLSPTSLLDVGTGVGSWLRAARERGVGDVLGIDGVVAEPAALHVEPGYIEILDLRQPVALGRRFDVVLCLEVAEHLPEDSAGTLVQTLCTHGDLVFFSAAAPGQHGEHHVNCRWPTYWQGLFNELGYVCNDDVRPRIWNDTEVPPWYRQNIFSAHRDPERAGHEPRIRHLIHPDMTLGMDLPNSPAARSHLALIEGKHHPFYYLRLLERSLRRRAAKLVGG